ncbi:MAG TPA: ribosome maturation factor RimM [Spirochaetota bacterium]|nr:ribosome maturation factor RimM [Spirochaetota bacterium]
MSDSYYTVAKVSSPFGLDGGLKLSLITDFPGRFVSGRRLFVDINGFYREVIIKSFTVTSGKHGTMFLEGVCTRADAESLRGYNLVIPESEVRDVGCDLADDVFQYCDLMGCEVLYKGSSFGTVIDITEGGGGELLIIESKGREYMIPFVSEMVDTSAVRDHKITISPAEGLLEF